MVKELYSLIERVDITNKNIQVLILTMLVLVGIRFFSKILSSGNIVFFLINLPGTFTHELAHFIVGLILLGKPSKFTIIPKKKENGYVLGSISFSKITNINALPIALAPLLLFPISFYSFFYILLYFEGKAFIIKTIYIPILLGITIYSMLISSLPSRTDIKILFSKKIGLCLYGIILLFLMDHYVIKTKSIYFFLMNFFE